MCVYIVFGQKESYMTQAVTSFQERGWNALFCNKLNQLVNKLKSTRSRSSSHNNCNQFLVLYIYIYYNVATYPLHQHFKRQAYLIICLQPLRTIHPIIYIMLRSK